MACAGLVLAAQQAAAQYGSPSLLPLPPVTAVDAVATSYDTPGGSLSPYGSVFTSNRQETVPSPPSQDTIIPGAEGNSQFQEALANEWGACEGCTPGCCAPACGGWFGTAGAIVMGRNRANPFWTTYETNVNENQLMNTQNAGANWQGGWEFTGGYIFGGGAGCGGCATGNCGGCAPFMNCCGMGPGVAVTYWGLAPMTGYSQIDSPTNELSTPINLNQQSGPLEINGVPMGDYFDNASSHRIYRTDNVNNFEVNGLLGVWNVGRLTSVPFVGFRYFRFDESLAFRGIAGGGDPSNPDDWAQHQNRMVNNMYGVQFGSFNNYMIGQRWGVFFCPKVGLFANQMNGRTQVRDGNGNYLQDDFGNIYDIQAHKTDFSMLGEIDAGLTYFWRPNVFSYVGYRVIGIANIALSDQQFLIYEADYQGFREINQNGSLVLHGVMMGGGFFF
jgi:hypothetical protein